MPVLHVQPPENAPAPEPSHRASRDSPPDRSVVASTPMLTQVTRRAMATEFVVMLPAHAADSVELVVATLEELDAIERAITIYQPDSEISRVNQFASSSPVSVSEETFALLETSLLWSKRTDGAFDITAGPLVQAWGFTERNGRKPSTEEIEAARARVGYQQVKLSAADRTVRFLRPEMSINLGAIGKGDALDRLAKRLRQGGLNDFLIHGGNSSVIASGDQVQGNGDGWAVGLAHPTKPKRRLAGVRLHDMALGTSGTGKQFFHHRGRRYGHVIDPRTGLPAGDLASLTVLMKSAADADACATGLFVAGTDTIAAAADHDWMPAVVKVAQGGRQDAVDVTWQGEIDWLDPPAADVSQA